MWQYTLKRLAQGLVTVWFIATATFLAMHNVPGDPLSGGRAISPEIRANLEWGETPKTLRSDIGTVQLAADRKSFTFTPGPRPLGGTIFLQCEAEPCPAGTLTMGSVTTPVVAATSAGGTLYAIQPGWILVPSDNQDDAATAAPMSSTEAAQLESLGYLHTEGD